MNYGILDIENILNFAPPSPRLLALDRPRYLDRPDNICASAAGEATRVEDAIDCLSKMPDDAAATSTPNA